MTRDPLWLNFPRWMEESGIPQFLSEEIGLEGWVVFHKLVELDCDANLTPNWFSIHLEDISRWTGVDSLRIASILDQLEDREWIDRANRELEIQDIRIACPLPLSIDEDAVRQKMVGVGISGGRFVLRYWDDLGHLEKIERVIYLYQMLFGARFSPRIVEDLEEISSQYSMEIIYQLFQEGYQKKIKSLSWIKSHLSHVALSDQNKT